MQISVNVLSLTQEQREALAGFIITFPANEVSANVESSVVRLSAVASLDPAAAFGSPMGAEATEEVQIPLVGSAATSIPAAPLAQPTIISTAGPHLVIPNVDKNGLPWDSRIHSSNKALTEKGVWRARRGVDTALVSQVEIELRALMALPAPVQAAIATIPTTTEIPPPPVIAVIPQPTPAVALVEDRNAFVNVVKKATDAIQAQKMTQAELSACCLAVGIPSLALAGNRLDLIPQLSAAIDALIAGR